MNDESRRYLLRRARESIACALSSQRVSTPEVPAEVISARCGLFISLHDRATDQLRGCIGYIHPRRTLDLDVVSVAQQAAFSDHRFKPIASLSELDSMQIEISLLSPFEPVIDESDIILGTHGVCVDINGRTGLLLPQVADGRGWDLHTFLLQVCAKAGYRNECWKQPGAILSRFTAELFDDHSLNVP